MIEFIAKTIKGSGRGHSLGSPTINVSLVDVPLCFQHGVYACLVTINKKIFKAVLHFGTRPTFNDTDSCEVHVIDKLIDTFPVDINIKIIKKIRDIKLFLDVFSLQKQILLDINNARNILSSHD